MMRAQRSKRTACVPCHRRKVKCDAFLHIPCSACIARYETNECDLVRPRKLLRQMWHQTQSTINSQCPEYTSTCDQDTQQPRGSRFCQAQVKSTIQPVESFQSPAWDAVSPNLSDEFGHFPSDLGGIFSSLQPLDMDFLQIVPQANETNLTNILPLDNSSQNDVQIQKYQSFTQQAGSLPQASPIVAEEYEYEQIEYRNQLDHVSMLGEAASESSQPLLARIRSKGTTLPPAAHRASISDRFTQKSDRPECRGLDSHDISYLEEKGAFELPPRPAMLQLVSAYLEFAWPHCPILSRVSLLSQLELGTASSMLLHAIILNSVPYVPLKAIQDMGFPDRLSAMRSHNSKAILLYDFLPQKPQLVSLQTSVLLSTFQLSASVDKDLQFWHHNAVRIATGMGLHRNEIGEELDVSSHKLCRRIWWSIYFRDVVLAATGFQNLQLLDSPDCLIQGLTHEDWDEVSLSHGLQFTLTPVPAVQKQYHIECCGFVAFVVEFMRIRQSKKSLATRIEALGELLKRFATWRCNLPPLLSKARDLDQWTQDDLWPCLLQSLGLGLRCLIYRDIQKCRRNLGQPALPTIERQQLCSIFELDTIFGQILLWDAIRYFPPIFMVLVATVVAFHVERVSNESAGDATSLTSRTCIVQGIHFLEQAQLFWPHLISTVKLFDSILQKSQVLGAVRENGTGPLHSGHVTSPTDTQGFNYGTDIVGDGIPAMAVNWGDGGLAPNLETDPCGDMLINWDFNGFEMRD